MTVMLYNIAMDTEIANMELLLPGEVLVRFLQASGHNSFVQWLKHNLVLCLKTPYLIYYGFINSELTPDKAYLTHIFSP